MSLIHVGDWHEISFRGCPAIAKVTKASLGQNPFCSLFLQKSGNKTVQQEVAIPPRDFNHLISEETARARLAEFGVSVDDF